ncbi:hypothetical protein C7293_03375 [filamentous cyanobacterium CCT1]|nr:hypothetical protein C7293_03375 [filamentous cyanobacterium CCT1]PSN79349.1 hypothetical protein C8B47_12235 [filamentous cyanobacterium CCP4]
MQMPETNPDGICHDIHQLLKIIRSKHQKISADIFALLGQLDPDGKRQFLTWLDQHDHNLKQWLLIQGNQRRAA